MRRTAIRFSVSVPVLSLQTTVTVPSAPTADRRLIHAFRRAILHIPRARAMLVTIGRPSGIAATASAMAVSIIRSGFFPTSRPEAPTAAATAIVSQINRRPSR